MVHLVVLQEPANRGLRGLVQHIFLVRRSRPRGNSRVLQRSWNAAEHAARTRRSATDHRRRQVLRLVATLDVRNRGATPERSVRENESAGFHQEGRCTLEAKRPAMRCKVVFKFIFVVMDRVAKRADSLALPVACVLLFVVGSCGKDATTGPDATRPPTPTSFLATAVSSSQIDLSWDASPGAHYYWVGLDWQWVIVIAPANTSSWSDLEAGREYCFRIIACGDGGASEHDLCSEFTEACATTSTVGAVRGD